MDKKIEFWFKGFENAIEAIGENSREVFFSECSKNCVKRGALDLYKKLYDRVNGDLDLFFNEINSVEGVRGEIVNSQSCYNIIFEKCTCSLHNEGYVNTPLLCQCSKQSTIHVFKTIMPNREFTVEICSTILRGDRECKLTASFDK